MNRVIILDAGPLGLASNPRRSAQSLACARWLQQLLRVGVRVLVPEIADYEVRRELLRAKKTKGLERLDGLSSLLEYLPLTTAAMRLAAVFWAQARQQGKPTSGAEALDADAILAAQAMTIRTDEVMVATTNIGHLSRFVKAELWQNIPSVEIRS